MPAPESSYHSRADFPTQQGFPQPNSPASHCWLMWGLCSAQSLLRYPSFPKDVTMQASSIHRGKDFSKNLHQQWIKLQDSRTVISYADVSEQLWDFLSFLLLRLHLELTYSNNLQKQHGKAPAQQLKLSKVCPPKSSRKSNALLYWKS